MSELFVPGRLCLFGEHSDWAGSLRHVDPAIVPGLCLIVGTDQGVRATAMPAEGFQLTTCLPDGSRRGPFTVPLDRARLHDAAAQRDFFSYAAGTAAIVTERFGCGGVRIDVEAMDLPIGRGLSSSAAICVLTARAFSTVHGLNLSPTDEMEIAYQGELMAGSQCGRMDQACAFGKQPVLLRFDGDDLNVETVPAGAPMYLLIVDLMHRKDTRKILSDLHAAFMDVDSAARENLRAALGAVNEDVATHARDALVQGDSAALGSLMTRAQQVFDLWVAPLSIGELQAPRLHSVLRGPRVSELTWGGKGVGSQGDGCAQFVCRGVDERTELTRQIAAAGLGRCLPLTIGE